MSLQQILIEYLESKGWYFDWDYIHEVWGDVWNPDEPDYESRDENAKLGPTPDNEPDAIRKLNGWTVPQWVEYWMEPYSDDPTHKNFGKPKTRRYESLKEAVWSQLLREEDPARFAGFFQDKTETT